MRSQVFERTSTPEFTPEQQKTKSELERAPTLTDFIGVLYDRVPTLRNSFNDDLTTDQIISAVLDVTGGEHGENRVTNKMYALRTMVKEKFDPRRYIPTVADQMIRHYFKRWDKSGKTHAMPSSDLPQDPEFYRQPCPTPDDLVVLMQRDEVRPSMRESNNERFVQRILALKNVFGSVRTINDLVDLLQRQKLLYPDIHSNSREPARPINAKPIAVLLESWLNGEGGDRPLEQVFRILENHFELSQTIRRLALKHLELRQHQSQEQFSDFIQDHLIEINNAWAAAGPQRLRVVGVATGSSAGQIHFRPQGSRGSGDIIIKSLSDLRAKGIRFENSALEQALSALRS